MGIILARFRKKKTTYEVIEKLDNEIKSIEEYGRNTELKQKRIVGRFILISIFGYVLSAAIFYFYFFPSTTYGRVWYFVPLIFAPVILFSIKFLLSKWYGWKLSRNESKLVTLKEQKTKMLETIMETETYKVAKKILEKFAPEQVANKKNTTIVESTPVKTLANSPIANPSTVRFRGPLPRPLDNHARTSWGAPITPLRALPGPNTTLVARSTAGALATPRPMPRSILPPERSVFDKMVDYLVGDGPSNRFALICQQCKHHNGMALKEEFEYVSYHCCYCSAFNPARKKRPIAPKLGPNTTANKSSFSDDFESDTSTSERKSNSDDSASDNEDKIKKDIKIPEIDLKATPSEDFQPAEEEVKNLGEPEKMDFSPIRTQEEVESKHKD